MLAALRPFAVLAMFTATTLAEPNSSLPLAPSPRLQAILDRSIAETLVEFAGRKLEATQLASTVIDLTDPAHPTTASYRGREEIYPASVIKLFFLAAAQQWLADKRLADTEELRRALRDMIVDSGNEPSHYLVDLLTDTTSGPELPEAELRAWQEKRQAITRYFSSLGYQGVHAHRKPWNEGPYGRESQAARTLPPASNFLTTEATARLLAEIALRRFISPDACEQMLTLLARDLRAAVRDPEDQTHGFTGIAAKEIPDGKLWSKAGYTSRTRHDAAYLELPDGRRLVIVTFTSGHSNERGIIPAVARRVLAGLGEEPAIRLAWEKEMLTIQHRAIPEKIVSIHYLEAFCRPGSTDRDWRETVIPHQTEKRLANAQGSRIELRNTLADGVTVDHLLESVPDGVAFQVTAHNRTATASQAHWAQPCMRVDRFVGVAGGRSEEYLPKSFLFLEGKLASMPTAHWAKEARYIPGQVWCPKHVDRNDVNPRPLSANVPSNGLIGCFSDDGKWLLATAWEPYQELFQGVITCLHSDFRIGGLQPGETKKVRGKVYLVNEETTALLARYARDFPEHQ